MKSISRLIALVASLLFFALAGCQVIQIEDREFVLEHDPVADTIDMLVVYRGVSVWRPEEAGQDPRRAERPVDPHKLEQAIEVAQEILGGRRRFQIMDGFYEFDLDDQEDVELAPIDVAIREGAQMLAVEAFLDEEERLSCYQHLRFHGAARLVARLNELFNLELAREFDDEKISESDYPESARLWARAAATGWQWLRFEGPILVVAIPATPQDTVRALLEALQSGDDSELWLAVADLRLAEESVELVFGSPAEPRVHLTSTAEQDDYEASLRHRLEEELREPLPTLDAEQVRAAFWQR